MDALRLAITWCNCKQYNFNILLTTLLLSLLLTIIFHHPFDAVDVLIHTSRHHQTTMKQSLYDAFSWVWFPAILCAFDGEGLFNEGSSLVESVHELFIETDMQCPLWRPGGPQKEVMSSVAPFVFGWCSPTSACYFGSRFATLVPWNRSRRKGLPMLPDQGLSKTLTIIIPVFSPATWYGLYPRRLSIPVKKQTGEKLTVQVSMDWGTIAFIVLNVFSFRLFLNLISGVLRDGNFSDQLEPVLDFFEAFFCHRIHSSCFYGLSQPHDAQTSRWKCRAIWQWMRDKLQGGDECLLLF